MHRFGRRVITILPILSALPLMVRAGNAVSVH